MSSKRTQTGAFPLWLILIIILFIAGGGYLGWQWWQGQQSPSPASTPPSPTPSEPATPTPSPTPSPAPVTISETLRENIEAAINTMNTAALEGYMTDPVTVVLAASQKGGPVTPAQAVAD